MARSTLGHTLSIVAPCLIAVQATRATAGATSFAYDAGASLPVIALAKAYWPSSEASAVLMWMAAATILSLPWRLCWTRLESLRPWTVALAMTLTTAPPLCIIGWASPLLSAGVLFPNRRGSALLEITVNKRMSGRWMMLSSFNWTGQHFLQNGVPTNPLMAYNSYVRDSYWTSHFGGTYQAPWGMLISPILRMQQGQPTDQTYSIAGLRVGSYALIADPFGAWRYDNLFVFDTRLEKQFKAQGAVYQSARSSMLTTFSIRTAWSSCTQ